MTTTRPSESERRGWRPSLRAKVAILVAVFSLSGSGAASLVAYRHLVDLTERESLNRASALLEASADTAARAVESADYLPFAALSHQLLETSHGELVYLALFASQDDGTTWTLLSEAAAQAEDWGRPSPAFLSRAGPSKHARFGPARRDLDMSTPIDSQGGRAILVARFSLTAYDRQLTWFARTMLGTTFALAVLGALLAISLLNRLVLAPTRALARVASQLGKGSLDARSDISSDDELGALGEALNATAERLSHYTRELEDEVRARTAELESANEELQRLATTDGLTSLKNHRAFQEALAFEFLRAQRHPRHLALCMLDIDHFKHFNDTFGHPEGDEILRRVGQVLLSKLRATDIVARYGGEEFAVVLLDTSPLEAFQTANKICEVFRRTEFPGEEHQPLGKITVSVGVASFPEDASTPSDLIRKADFALYEAKRRGRNRAVMYEASIRPPLSTDDLEEMSARPKSA